MTLTNKRSIMYRWIAVGLTSGIVANAAAWFFWPRLDPIAEPIDRLLLAVQCSAGIGFVALIMMQGLWRLHDVPQSEDPFAVDSHVARRCAYAARHDDNLVRWPSAVLGRVPSLTQCSSYRYGLDNCYGCAGCSLAGSNVFLGLRSLLMAVGCPSIR